MLIQLRVENHRSLRDEQVLSMVAADLGDTGSERLIHAGGLGHALLPAVALYGANASGKSNVIGALNFMRSAVLESHRLWEPDGGTPQEPFVLSAKVDEPSLYEIDILLNGTRFQYGFVLSATKVEEEWLYAWPRGRKKLWFEREGETFRFAKTMPGENEAIQALTRPNSLFLSAAAQNNHETLLPIFQWFSGISFMLRHDHLRPERFLFMQNYASGFPWSDPSSPWWWDDSKRERLRQPVMRLLQAADIGVLDIDLRLEEQKKKTAPVSHGPGFRRVIPRPTIARYELHLRHQTEDGEAEAWLPLSKESAGTITLLQITADLFSVLEHGSLLAIDELEASLHPMLALEIVRLFNDPEQNPNGAQLIFTTHDTNLLGGILDEPALRRDQVWFTEKDRGGATHLYPLTDFHPRAEENLERGYRQGRYGAIPFLGRLVSAPEKEAPEKEAPEKKKKRKG